MISYNVVHVKLSAGQHWRKYAAKAPAITSILFFTIPSRVSLNFSKDAKFNFEHDQSALCSQRGPSGSYWSSDQPSLSCLSCKCWQWRIGEWEVTSLLEGISAKASVSSGKLVSRAWEVGS